MGARGPKRFSTGRALRHKDWPRLSIQAGWRACQISARPRRNAAAWNMVQTGRIAMVLVPSTASPWTDPAAKAPNSEYPSMRLNWNVHSARVLRSPAARLMPAQAAPHMATQWGPPTMPMNRAVIAMEVCMKEL
ncbi:hypothetical protein D9M69_604930 [compost metagenome]